MGCFQSVCVFLGMVLIVIHNRMLRCFLHVFLMVKMTFTVTCGVLNHVLKKHLLSSLLQLLRQFTAHNGSQEAHY